MAPKGCCFAFALVACLLLFLHPVASEFACGTNSFQNWLAKAVVSADCRDRLYAYNNCCEMHDNCYNAQAGRSNCDDQLCRCLMAAENESGCLADSEVFCWLASTFGGDAYRDSAKRHLAH